MHKAFGVLWAGARTEVFAKLSSESGAGARKRSFCRDVCEANSKEMQSISKAYSLESGTVPVVIDLLNVVVLFKLVKENGHKLYIFLA